MFRQKMIAFASTLIIYMFMVSVLGMGLLYALVFALAIRVFVLKPLVEQFWPDHEEGDWELVWVNPNLDTPAHQQYLAMRRANRAGEKARRRAQERGPEENDNRWW